MGTYKSMTLGESEQLHATNTYGNLEPSENEDKGNFKDSQQIKVSPPNSSSSTNIQTNNKPDIMKFTIHTNSSNEDSQKECTEQEATNIVNESNQNKVLPTKSIQINHEKGYNNDIKNEKFEKVSNKKNVENVLNKSIK